ncbi:hypothetical protein FSP39_020656 [Pinctada imbricata]|uniref:Endonuclease/exonuclease/phosphatase domain-containing protein n=1 Tax=Pinctada imbricata TaxID=66713 RepID=A0AA88Y7B9_PINIB|nr:hypothetical protein FSP39_020656 [Pinctada imbricata]
MDLPQECLSCIALSGIKRVYSDCVGPTSGGINIPGLVLLSKRPLRNIRKVDLIPGIKQILPRSYLYAEVDGIGPIACTHLTANLGKIYYEPYLQSKFSSWRDQNLHDVQTLVQDFRDFPRMIIMGDLNCGPSVPEQNVAEDFSASFQALMDNNFTAPYVTKLGMCTYCHENKFVVQNENLIIDHILLKGFEAKSVKVS